MKGSDIYCPPLCRESRTKYLVATVSPNTQHKGTSTALELKAMYFFILLLLRLTEIYANVGLDVKKGEYCIIFCKIDDVLALLGPIYRQS